ncbi:MAG: hypothetical protein IIT82_00130, partial [Selenomonas sp.]|nr:hypothetical protein [Selenomonas sp.]
MQQHKISIKAVREIYLLSAETAAPPNAPKRYISLTLLHYKLKKYKSHPRPKGWLVAVHLADFLLSLLAGLVANYLFTVLAK